MSVMFEILDRVENHDGDAAAELVAKAWSTLQDPPAMEPAPPPVKAKAPARKAAKRAPKPALLDIRFEPAAAPRKRTRPSAKPAKGETAGPACDFASLWAMARLCATEDRKTARPFSQAT
jgi:hypothetical protein